MVISVVNQKGGVAKTTTSINLAAGLSLEGYKVLMIDADPQCNATQVIVNPTPKLRPPEELHRLQDSILLQEQKGLVASKHLPLARQLLSILQSQPVAMADLDKSLYPVVIEFAGLKTIIQETRFPNLHFAASHIRLSSVDLELASAFDNRAARLKRAVDAVRDHYDYIIIDCAPSLGLMTLNSFVASDTIIIPVSMSYFALVGLDQLLETIMLTQSSPDLNPQLGIMGVLLTMNEHTNVSRDVEKLLRNLFGTLVFESAISKNISIEEAHSNHTHIFDFAPKSAGAQAYQSFVKEVITRR